VISVDWTLLLQFTNFIILLLILNRLLYRPLQRIMRQRREHITGDQARAESLQSEIEAKMQQYQEQLNAAKSEANAERSQLKKDAANKEAEILAAAHANATDKLQQIKKRVAEESRQAEQTLRSETKSLADRIATKVLGRELT